MKEDLASPHNRLPGEAIVKFNRICKSYDGKTLAVRDLSLEVRPGEFLTLLGPSGSGKTTTLMILAGFEQPTSGEITFSGRSITALPPHRRNFGMVFQGYALFPHMTVLENVTYPLRMRKVPSTEAERRAGHALDMVKLSGFEARKPRQLSGGEQQRVALARALVFEPSLVLMDEPLGALDKSLREQMQIEIRHLHNRIGSTMIYVTHDQSEALTLSDRIAVFNGGNLQQVASPTDLYQRPANSFVARFIGENNQLDGEIVDINGTQCTVRLDDGQKIVAVPGRSAVVGSRTTLSIRPERLSIDGHATSNCLTGTVVESIYQGDHTRYLVAIGENRKFIVKLTNSENQRHLQDGDPVRLTWNSRDCLALDQLN